MLSKEHMEGGRGLYSRLEETPGQIHCDRKIFTSSEGYRTGINVEIEELQLEDGHGRLCRPHRSL